MPSRKEIDQLKNRKARLLRQNDVLRRHLLEESENLRGAAEWIERGHSFYLSGKKIRSWTSPISTSVGWLGKIGRMFR
jgi:hypothetical protein